MKPFNMRMQEVINPYIISAPAGMEPLYDYGVCGVLEELIDEYMDEGYLCATFSYLDFECDGKSINGCMTITIMEDVFVPIVYTILYERELNTCG